MAEPKKIKSYFFFNIYMFLYNKNSLVLQNNSAFVILSTHFGHICFYIKSSQFVDVKDE